MKSAARISTRAGTLDMRNSVRRACRASRNDYCKYNIITARTLSSIRAGARIAPCPEIYGIVNSLRVRTRARRGPFAAADAPAALTRPSRGFCPFLTPFSQFLHVLRRKTPHFRPRNHKSRPPDHPIFRPFAPLPCPPSPSLPFERVVQKNSKFLDTLHKKPGEISTIRQLAQNCDFGAVFEKKQTF